MCLGCYAKAGAPREITPAVLAIYHRLREADEFGACHIVVADWNVDDDDLAFCRDQPEATPEDRELMTGMLALSAAERHTAMALADGYMTETGELHAFARDALTRSEDTDINPLDR